MNKHNGVDIQLLNVLHYPVTLNDDSLIIIGVLDGSIDLMHGNKNYPLMKHRIAFINKHETYCFSSLDDTEACVLFARFKLERLQSHIPLFDSILFANRNLNGGESHLSVIGEAFYREIIYALIDMYFNINQPAVFDMLVDRFANVLYGQWSLVTYNQVVIKELYEGLESYIGLGKNFERFLRICKHLETAYNSDLSLHDIAQTENISKVYLTQFWKQCCDLPFFEFVSYYRALRAANALIFTQDTIINIAYAAGFSDAKYLYKAFNRWFAMTPKKWRQHWNQQQQVPSRFTSLSSSETSFIFEAYVDRYLAYEAQTTCFATQFNALYTLCNHTPHVGKTCAVSLDILDQRNIKICYYNLNNQHIRIPIWNSLGALIEKSKQLECQTRIRIKRSQINEHSFDIIDFFIKQNINMRGLRCVQHWNFELQDDRNGDITHLNEMYHFINTKLHYPSAQLVIS